MVDRGADGVTDAVFEAIVGRDCASDGFAFDQGAVVVQGSHIQRVASADFDADAIFEDIAKCCVVAVEVGAAGRADEGRVCCWYRDGRKSKIADGGPIVERRRDALGDAVFAGVVGGDFAGDDLCFDECSISKEGGHIKGVAGADLRARTILPDVAQGYGIAVAIEITGGTDQVGIGRGHGIGIQSQVGGHGSEVDRRGDALDGAVFPRVVGCDIAGDRLAFDQCSIVDEGGDVDCVARANLYAGAIFEAKAQRHRVAVGVIAVGCADERRVDGADDGFGTEAKSRGYGWSVDKGGVAYFGAFFVVIRTVGNGVCRNVHRNSVAVEVFGPGDVSVVEGISDIEGWAGANDHATIIFPPEVDFDGIVVGVFGERLAKGNIAVDHRGGGDDDLVDDGEGVDGSGCYFGDTVCGAIEGSCHAGYRAASGLLGDIEYGTRGEQCV